MGWRRRAAIGLGILAAVLLAPLAIIGTVLVIATLLSPGKPGVIATGTPFDRVTPGMTRPDVEKILGPGRPIDGQDVPTGPAPARSRAGPFRIDRSLDYRHWSTPRGDFYIGFRDGRVTTRIARPR